MTNKKVISFSVYGKYPEYTWGAIDNARHARWFYPDWVCRFYVADDVPRGIISRLKDHGAEVINMGQYLGHEARLWRFSVAVDPEVDIAIVRDTDSRFSKYELIMVNEWLASSKKFHVMYPINKAPIQGGMWGIRGSVPEFREPLENFLQSPGLYSQGADQYFLSHNLYPLIKGDVYVHEASLDAKPRNLKQRHYFIDEPIQPFNSFWGNHWYIRTGRPRRMFMALSIYKNIPFYEYFLAQLISTIENRNLFHLINGRTGKAVHLNVRFYVADDIRPDLVERLRSLGQVIMKPTRTVHKDDPQYWKLSILADKNLGLATIIGFWEFFFLARGAGKVIELQQNLLYYYPTGIKSKFRNVTPLGVCGPEIPLAQIEDLVAQRDPDESYQKFVRSTLYPEIEPVISNFMLLALPKAKGVGFLKGWSLTLLTVMLGYDRVDRIKEFLKRLFRR